jgi:hypothetical protein
LKEQPHRVDVAQIGCDVAQLGTLGCDVAQMVVHQLTVRQARVSSIPSSVPQGGFLLTELTSDEEMERNLGDWRLDYVLYECDGMNVCTREYKNKQKKWHHATKL